MKLFYDIRNIDVAEVTVHMTDRRTELQYEDSFCVPEMFLNRTQIVSDYANYGFTVNDIIVNTVSAPINWAHVYGFYRNVKGTDTDEGLEQTIETETVSA